MPPIQQVEWEDFEYLYYERSTSWFWSLYIVSGGLLVLALFLRNFLFAVFILLAAFTTTLYAKRKPDTIRFEVNRMGVTEGKKYYPYSLLTSFWIDETIPEMPKLLLLSKKAIVPLIVIPLMNTDHDVVRNIIANYLPEREAREPVSNKIMEYLGF